MSRGAIDFGFLADGPIVVLEALLAATLGKKLGRTQRALAYSATIREVVRPVALSVAIIMLVYLPLLGLQGVEGKMFRPMAITMAFALLGALVYAVVFLPALLVLFVPPPARDGAAWLGRVQARYACLKSCGPDGSCSPLRPGRLPLRPSSLLGRARTSSRASTKVMRWSLSAARRRST